MKKYLTSKGFIAKQVDEVELHEISQALLKNSETVDMGKIFQEHGLNVTTSLLYQKVLSSKHTDFINTLNKQPVSPISSAEKLNKKCLIIPGMFYQEHPESDSDGKLIASIFEKNHYETEIIQTHSTGSVSENKEIIKQALHQQSHQNIWLFSISKGTADLRACLQEFDKLPSNIKGWISFSGIFSGSILASSRTDSLYKRIFLKLLCQLMNIKYSAIEELKPEHHYWKQSNQPFKHIELIHVVGFPLLSHVQPLIAHRFKKLSMSGPTDGMIDLAETLNYPGNLFPIWGSDHFLRNKQTSELLYKLCHYISRSTNPTKGT